MKFNVNLEPFIKALESAYDVATKVTIKEFPYAEKITIKAMKDQVVAFAFGGTASIIAPITDSHFSEIEYSCEEEGEATVNAKNFMGYLRSLPSEKITITKSKNKLMMALVSHPTIHRGVSTYDQPVITITPAQEFSQEISINREIFIQGLNKVAFAISDEKTAPHYQCLSLTANEGSVTLSAGNGARFAVNIFEGDKIAAFKGKIDLKIPQEHVQTLKSILQRSSDSNIYIRYSTGDNDKILEQLMFSFNGFVLCIKDVARFDGFPKLDGILENKYSNKLVCDLKDWQYPMKAIVASYNAHEQEVLSTQLMVDIDNNNITISTKTDIPSNDDIPMSADNSIVSGKKLWFCANSAWFENLASCFSKEGVIEIHFDSQEEIANLDLKSVDDQKIIKKFKKKPILVKYPEKPDGAKDILEKFYIFFVVSASE